jgi:MYXO-CTERM domain-containing protein
MAEFVQKEMAMRKTAATALIALFLAVAPAGAAFSQPAERADATVAAATVQAQDDNKDDDGGNEGLWGLFGLLGLAGLIPWRKNRGRQNHRGTTDTTGRSTGI